MISNKSMLSKNVCIKYTQDQTGIREKITFQFDIKIHNSCILI